MYIGAMRQLKSEMKLFQIDNDLFLVEKTKSNINGNKRYKVHFINGELDKYIGCDHYIGVWSIQAYSEEEAAIDVYCNLMGYERSEINVVKRLS